jgi:hypothetical protein
VTDESGLSNEAAIDAQQPEPESDGSSRGRKIAVGVGIAAGVGALYFGISGAVAFHSANQLSASLRQVQDAARSLDISAAASALTDARSSAHTFNFATAGPLWAVAAHAPGIGGQIDAGRRLAGDVDSILSAAEPITNKATTLSQGGLRASDGTLDLAAISGLEPAMRDTAAATRAAATDLESLDPSDLPPALAKSVATVSGQLPEISHRISDLAEGLGVIPSMLGGEGPRSWAVLFQNPGEIRATGGLIGGFSLLTFNHGKVSVAEVGTNEKLASTSGPVDYSVLPDEVVSQWGKELSEWNSFNLSPHFPYTAMLTEQGMKQRNTPVEGVIAIDPTMVAALLAGTGPVTVRGDTITAANAIDFITKDVYVKYPDVPTKAAVLVEIVGAVFKAVSTGKLDEKSLLSGVWNAEQGGHLLAWSTKPKEQAWLRETHMGGVLPEDSGPHVLVALVNGSGSKIDTYLTAKANYEYGNCANRLQQDSTVTVALTNGAPDGLPPYVVYRADDPFAPHGGSRTLVDVYGPNDAQLIDFNVDGQGVGVRVGTERGHPVWTFIVDIAQGATAHLSLHFSEPAVTPAIENPTPSFVMQPMPIPPTVTLGAGTCDGQ